MMINFKYYYRQAIVRNKTNLDDMVRAVWAIWKHKVQTKTLTEIIFLFRLLQMSNRTMNGVLYNIVDI